MKRPSPEAEVKPEEKKIKLSQQQEDHVEHLEPDYSIFKNETIVSVTEEDPEVIDPEDDTLSFVFKFEFKNRKPIQLHILDGFGPILVECK